MLFVVVVDVIVIVVVGVVVVDVILTMTMMSGDGDDDPGYTFVARVPRPVLEQYLVDLQNVDKHGEFALSAFIKPQANNSFVVKCKCYQKAKCQGALLYRPSLGTVDVVDVFWRDHVQSAHEEAYSPHSDPPTLCYVLLGDQRR